jgi:predicted DNA-binding transcriptional regulator AlpA
MSTNDWLTTTAVPAETKEPAAKSSSNPVRESPARVLPKSKRAKQHGDRDRGHHVHGDHGHGDRGDVDDDAAPSMLPLYIRYRDLAAAGIVASWNQLFKMIDTEGFPPGVLLSPNIRAWKLADVEEWLAKRPSGRRPMRGKKTAAASNS